MPRPLDFIPRTLSARINLQTVTAITLLLIASIVAVFVGTWLITKVEAEGQVEETLDAIAYRIDNTLLSVEQTATIIQGDIPNHLDSPRKLFDLSQKAIEANPYIAGCAIALNPDYYTHRGQAFMAYVHRTHEEILSSGRRPRPFVRSGTFTSKPFTEQEWFTKPLAEGVPSWVGPLKDEDTEKDAIISYDVPIMVDTSRVAVLGVDISLSILTEIAQNYRTSKHSYITLLDKDGSYIIHPDSTKLFHMNSLAALRDAEDPVVRKAAGAMLAGEKGKCTFTLDSTQYYMAYMPFRQSATPGRRAESQGWSIAVIYQRKELLDRYAPDFTIALIITIGGILLLLIGCEAISRLHLKPLRKLTNVTRNIAKGKFILPDYYSAKPDEVGRLQSHFMQMTQALSGHIEQLQNLSVNESARQDILARTYEKTKEIDKLRSAFFSNMTHQMADVVADIQTDMGKLDNDGREMEESELKDVLDSIERNGIKVTDILSDMLNSKN